MTLPVDLTLVAGTPDHQLLHRCWAEVGRLGQRLRCPETVPPDPDHIGLCEGCLGRLRRKMPL